MTKLSALLFLLFTAPLFAQLNDSASVISETDSLSQSDSVVTSRDTTLNSNQIDAVVYASASDSLKFYIKSKLMNIYGQGELQYKKTELKSGMINIDFETNELYAEGVADSSDNDGLKKLQTPVMNEDGEIYEGYYIKYDFDTKRGFISEALNRKENEDYGGNKVKKVSENIFFIEDGVYNPCGDTASSTYFTAERMKVIQNDKIFAEWIFMHIGGVPLPVPIPFGVFPSERGRRSGLIIPTYGNSADRGHYFNDMGYFFAFSDYFDLTLLGDYYTRGGYGLEGIVRYNKRYDFTGNLNAGYIKTVVGEENDPNYSKTEQWQFRLNHNQNLSPTARLTANLNFSSSNYSRYNSTNVNELLTRQVVSSATYNKRWEEWGASLSASFYRTQQLDDGEVNEDLPNISLSLRSDYLFRNEQKTDKDYNWYEYIRYSYSSNLRRKRSLTVADGEEIRSGIQHNISLSANPKLGFFNISPSISYQEKWYNKRRRLYVEDTSSTPDTSVYVLRDERIDRFNQVRTFDLRLTASTKMYGIFQPNMLGIEAFRHTISPSISYNFTPDFSLPGWGYYDSYIDENGDEVRYDKYSDEIYGGVNSSESQSINFGIGNVFELKTMQDPTDTTSEQQKFRLMSVDVSSGYNFAADSLKLRDLSVNYNTNIANGLLNVSGGLNYTFYNTSGSRKTDEFLASSGRGLFRLTNMSINLSTNLSGDKLSSGESKKPEEDNGELPAAAFDRSEYVYGYDEAAKDLSIPWNLSMNLSYRLSRYNPQAETKSANLSLNAGIKITENWKITGRLNYDLIEMEIAAPSFSINRDLGCWDMSLQWNPIGFYRGYSLEIKMKPPQLQDIKVDKSGGLYSGIR